MSSTNRLEFGDTGTYINQSGDGVLNITSDTEVEINATTIDINGAVAMDGAITGGTNITISGELDAATLDISGNADIDGTLEADAITVDSVALNEYIADTIGAMVGSNTESGIAVDYQDGDNTLDFTVATLNQDTTGTADNITISANNSTNETVYPIFVDGATGSQGAESDTGLTYNPSSGNLAIGGELAAATLDISGSIDVNGTANLDIVDIDGAVNMASTLLVEGDYLTIDNSAQCGVKIETNDTAVIFSVDKADNSITGGINWAHDTGDTTFMTAGTNVRFKLDSNSRISLSNNDGGASNTVFGYLAGAALTTNGDNNVIIGDNAGNDVTTGDQNTIIGHQAGDALVGGDDNTFIGQSAGGATTAGTSMTIVGRNAGTGVLTANAVGTVLVGFGSGAALTDGAGNLAVGYQAGQFLTTGSANTFVGHLSGTGITGTKLTGDYNTCLGYYAGNDLQGAAASNILIGNDAGALLKTGARNVVMGGNAFDAADGAEADNIAIGYAALGSLNNDSSLKNIAIGNYALDATSTNNSNQNVAIGHQAGTAVTSGTDNVLVGYQAGETLTTGTSNVLIGGTSAASAVGGTNQIAIGYGAAGQADNSVTLGNASVTAVYMSQDSGATVHAGAMGIGLAGAAHDGTLHVHTATAGTITANANHDELVLENSGNAGLSILAGTGNTCIISFGDSGDNDIGYIQYHNSSDDFRIATNTGEHFIINSSGNVGIGTLTPDRNLVIGGSSASARITPETDDTGYLGESDHRWEAVFAVNGTIQTSDERQKTEITDTSLGLGFIKQLRPVSYKWKIGGYDVGDGVQIELEPEEVDSEGNVIKTAVMGLPKKEEIAGKRNHYGLIAQEVKEVLGDTDFGGWLIDDLDDSESTQSLRYYQFISPLIKAIQELSAKVEELEAKLK